MSIVILTEKPSVAKAIGQALGKPTKGEGYLQVNEMILTWAVGHLVSLAPPEAYHSEWKSWRMAHLPMMPDEWKLMVNARTMKQFQVVKAWLKNPEVEKIIFATDAGAEGELIARWIYQKCQCHKPVERLWISSLTQESIQKGLKSLSPIHEFDSLYDSALLRAQADWLLGLNATRAVTCSIRANDQEAPTYTLGRVQTPTLKKVVDRERAIREFTPETYYLVEATFEDSQGLTYKGTWNDLETNQSRINDRSFAEEIVQATAGRQTEQINILEEEEVIPPPTLLSLPLLEQQAIHRFKWTAAEVNDVAQELYDKGLITYPRTGDSLVTVDVAAEFPHILKQLYQNGYQDIGPEIIPDLTQNPRVVGDVTDHHAIIPTGKRGNIQGKAFDLYDYIVRVFLSAHHPAGKNCNRTVWTEVHPHSFRSAETCILEPGWRRVWGEKATHSKLKEISAPVLTRSVDVLQKETVPPSRYTEASLIKEMEKCHLGTPATRAGILEKLKKQQYMELKDHSLFATEKAETLIQHLQHSPLVSVQLTSHLERQLLAIQRGEQKKETVHQEIETLVRDIVKEAKALVPPNEEKKGKVLGSCPRCMEGRVIKKENPSGEWFYGCNRYRNGCRFFVPGAMAGQTLGDEDIRRLLQKGRTKTKRFLFKNKVHKTAARLMLKLDGTTTFDFKPRWFSRIREFLFG
jgi:DNA topoisomerase III